ncbi:MAG: oligosaccharide flippase family protein [Acetobacteraceae bacterium]|nr:oligosaccharide flippase family protein [Acetobacteraceae bacterium]
MTHIAFRLLDVALAVVTGATARLAMPRLAALQHDRAALARAYGELTQLQALIGLPVTVGMAIAAPRLIELLLGGPWLAAAGPARLVALAAVPLLLVGPASALWLAVGRTRMNLLMHAIAFAVPLLLLALLRPAGPEGAALCWIGGSLAVPPMQLWLILRELGRPLSWLLGQLLVPVAATLAMAGAAGWVALRMAGEPAITALPVTALAGAAVYLLAVLLALRGRWPRALLEA